MVGVGWWRRRCPLTLESCRQLTEQRKEPVAKRNKGGPGPALPELRDGQLAHLAERADLGLGCAGQVDAVCGATVDAPAAAAESGPVVDDADASFAKDAEGFVDGHGWGGVVGASLPPDT